MVTPSTLITGINVCVLDNIVKFPPQQLQRILLPGCEVELRQAGSPNLISSYIWQFLQTGWLVHQDCLRP